MAPAGRPRINIKWSDVEKLCHIQCTQAEIAGFIGCSVDTLERACLRDHGKNFAEYFNEKREVGKISIRRAQYQKMVEGNPTMLIWGGKQYLGQRDVQDITLGVNDEFSKLSDDELLEMYRVAAQQNIAALDTLQNTLTRRNIPDPNTIETHAVEVKGGDSQDIGTNEQAKNTGAPVT